MNSQNKHIVIKADIDKVKSHIQSVSSYVGNCDDWVTIKKEALLSLPPRLRKMFSTRDPKTKEQWLNNFEKELVIYYKELTGIDLILRSLEERRNLKQ